MRDRFVVFAGACYYPRAGFADLQGFYATLEEAVAAGKACKYEDWYIVYDMLGDWPSIVNEGVPDKEPF